MTTATSIAELKKVQFPTMEELDGELAYRSLNHFIKQLWPQVDPSDYVPGWHIDAICEHLEAVTRGEIKRLVINIPPRHMKSLAVGVFWPAWEWLRNPAEQWLFASYAESLSIRDSVKCRRLIQSPSYQALLSNFQPDLVLTGDQNTKIRFENNFGGYRLATSVGGALTGEGGGKICLPYEQEIMTDHGMMKIGDIVVKELSVNVLSFEHEHGVIEYQPIETRQTYPDPEKPLQPNKAILEIELEDGHVFRCTADHEVWTKNRGYIAAGELRSGDECGVAE